MNEHCCKTYLKDVPEGAGMNEHCCKTYFEVVPE